MHFLKCNNCGHLNEVKTEFLIFCSRCNKKLDNNFSDWHKRHPEKSLDDFKQLMCVSEEDIRISNQKPKSKKNKKLLFAGIGCAVVFVIAVAIMIFYVVGHYGGDFMKKVKNSASEKILVEYANETNKACPVMINNITRLDNAIALPDNTVQFNYTVMITVTDSAKINEMKSIMEPQIITSVKNAPDMKMLRDIKTTINYSYKDSSGAFLFMISVKPKQYE